MMIAVIVWLVWDKHKLLPVFSYNKPITGKAFPDPERIWIVAGMMYVFCFIALYLLNPLNGDVYTKWISVVLLLMIFLTFIVSNYKFYRTRKLTINAYKLKLDLISCRKFAG